MGDPINEREAGRFCDKCRGVGKPWGDTITPKYIYMTGSGFEDPCGGCNNTFVLKQDPVNPCFWWLDIPGTEMMYQLTDIGSHFFMACPGVCYNFSEPPCKTISTRHGRTVEVT